MEDRSRLSARVGATVAGRFRVDRLVGLGGMAAVYAATDCAPDADGRRVALKILHRDLLHDPHARAIFAAERAAAARVQHRGRVEVLGEAETEQGEPVLVLELLEGEDLACRLARRGRLALREALEIAAAILDVLEASHAAGVVHGDLKPENVFLVDGEPGAPVELKVLDFGIAQAPASSERSLAIGTPAFMPPEQARGASLDARADVFAVGAILWTLLSGRELRTARNAGEVLRMASAEPPRSLALVAPEMPREVVRIVDRALRSERAERWSSAAEMRAAIDRVLEDLAHDPVAHDPSSGTFPRHDSGRITLPEVPRALANRR